MPDYDVFLSYSGENREAATEVATGLKDLGLKVWFDQWVLPPGKPFQPYLLEGVQQSKSTALVIGPKGLGKWQNVELEAAINRQVTESNYRVIPVILPGTKEDEIELPAVLKRNTWVLLGPSLRDGTALERVYWGITGIKHVSQTAPQTATRPVSDRSIELAIAGLCDTLRTDNVTYFIGPSALPGSESMPPTPSEIARGLLLDVHLIDPNYNNLLPPADVAGSYYAAGWGFSRLENKVVEMMASRSAKIPEIYDRLAKLISVLSARPKPRIRSRIQQLIVTTNLDVLIERALLRRGISFTRLVQHTGASRMEINHYHRVSSAGRGVIELPGDEGAIAVDCNNWEELDDVIANYRRSSISGSDNESPGTGVLNKLPLKDHCADGPILYKFRGSQDVRNSCALSVDQYLKYLRGLLRQVLVPAQITEILNSTPIVLLGYGYFDPDFRLVYHGLLRQALELRQDPVYSVQQRPGSASGDLYSRMELELWDQLKTSALVESKIRVLEALGEEFLRQIIETVDSKSASVA